MNKKISILLTAWKEEKTIGKCIETITDGIRDWDFELILACPDVETMLAAEERCIKLEIRDNFKHIQDPQKGKPTAVAMLMDAAQGDIWVFGDGDVYYGERPIPHLIEKIEAESAFAVSGRPVSADSKTSLMGYWGHLLADAAHHKRMIDLTADPAGHGTQFVKKREFFPVSGYLFALKPTNIRPPADTLVEDAYISYAIHNEGKKIVYAPEAKVFVKYATTLKDYFAQKKRSVGGYLQLWKYDIVKSETNTRSFSRELEYFWFPINYAKNIRELLWSLCLYPTRLWLWLKIFWERRIRRKSFVDTWTRIESTK